MSEYRIPDLVEPEGFLFLVETKRMFANLNGSADQPVVIAVD